MFDTKIYELDRHELKSLTEEIRKLIIEIRELHDILRPKAKSATLVIRPKTWGEEEFDVYQYLSQTGRRFMPATINVGGTATGVFKEFTGLNGTGDEIAPLQQPIFVSSDESVATVDASGLVTGVAVGSAVITGTDPGNSLTASDSVEVHDVVPPPPVAQSATFSLTAN